MTRRGYLDWLRGVAVLIMIEGHVFDAWTRVEDRSRDAYGWSIMIAGFGAPIFLFLAGVSIALAAGARRRRGMSDRDATARALRRGAQIFGLAFLFRLQAWIISRGAFAATLLKVDILNVMGIAMMAAAIVWRIAGSTRARAACLAASTIAVAMATPLVRSTALLAPLPDPIEWYVRPAAGRTTFTLFPWAAFLLAGAAVGLWVGGAQTPAAERHVNGRLAAIGGAMALGGYAASFAPSIYPASEFWTSSPTFFFLRLGLVIAAVPLAYLWTLTWTGVSPLQQFGAASLFVYWIHVEMIYGLPSVAIHRRLTLEQTALAYVAFTAFLFALVILKDRFVRARRVARLTADSIHQ